MDFLIHLDHILFQLINQTLTSSWQDVIFPFITDLHKQLWFKSTAYPALLSFYIYKFKKLGILYFAFCAIALGFNDWAGNKFIKKVVDRPRPSETMGIDVIQRSPAHGRSFISNHSSNMFALATYTTAFFPAGRFVFFAVATTIAYSRVYNGVHFPLDVICGAMWGSAIALFFVLLAKWLGRQIQIKRKS